MLLWKIYFFFIVLISIPLYLLGASGESLEFATDLSFFVVLIIGVFGFIWKRKIVNRLVWRIFFPISVAWNLGHAYYTFDGLFTIVITAIYIPTLIALYFYAFKSEDLWSS